MTHRVTCFMTPRDLREIADQMEQQWSTLLPGRLTDVKEWFVDQFTTINFSIDQERARVQMGAPGAALKREPLE